MYQPRVVDNLWQSNDVTPSERGPSIAVDADLCAKEPMVHIFPPTKSALARRNLIAGLVDRMRYFSSLWICSTWSSKAMEASLLDFADRLDNDYRLTSRLPNPLLALRRSIELQRHYGIAAGIILHGATTEVVVDFLVRFAPRWGVHIIILPSRIDTSAEDDGSIDLAAVQAICRKAYLVENVSVESTREDIDWMLQKTPIKTEVDIDMGWVLRCCDRCGYPVGSVQLVLKMIDTASVEPLVLKQLVDAELTKLPHDKKNGGAATLLCLSTILTKANRFAERDALWALIVLPPSFPSIALDADGLKLLVECQLVQHYGRDKMVLVEDWVREALEIAMTERLVTDGTAALLKRLQQLDEFVIDHPPPQWSQEQLWRDRWRSCVVEYVVKSVRRRRLYFPKIGALFEPKQPSPQDAEADFLYSAPAASSVLADNISSNLSETFNATAGEGRGQAAAVMPLPEDQAAWQGALLPLLKRAELLKANNRYREAAEQLDLVVAVCMDAVLNFEHGSELLVCSINNLYVEISSLLVNGNLAGLAVQYVERAEAMLKVLAGTRRDTPARALHHLLSGWKGVQLSKNEATRAEACRRTSSLNSDASDMLLKTIVKAEVEQGQYLRKGRYEYQEAIDALSGTPAALVGSEVADAHETISQSMTTEHNDREAWRHAAVALEAEQTCVRKDQTSVSRPPHRSRLTERDEIVWARANIERMVKKIRLRQYDEVNTLLDKCPMLAVTGFIEGSDDAVIYSDSREWKEMITSNSFPSPKAFDHLAVLTCFADLQVAKHHGLDWEKKSTPYVFAAHALLESMEDSDTKAAELLSRLLLLGMNPNTCSPHDMKSLLHIAVERELAVAAGALIRHKDVVVDATAEYRLSAIRKGLSTVAKVSQVPNNIKPPFTCCQSRGLLMQLLLECSNPEQTFKNSQAFIVEMLSIEDDGIEHSDNCDDEDFPQTKLAQLFGPYAPFHDEVPAVCADRSISSESRERVAWYCSQRSALSVLKSIDDAPTILVLMTIVRRKNDSPDLLISVVTHFIRSKHVHIAASLMERFKLSTELLFWEDAVQFGKMMDAEKEKEAQAAAEMGLAAPGSNDQSPRESMTLRSGVTSAKFW